MAYTQNTFTVDRGRYNNFVGIDQLALHRYKSITDDFATILTAGYFTENFGFNEDEIVVDDLLYIQDLSKAARMYRLTNVGPITLIEEATGLIMERVTFDTLWEGAFNPAVPTTGGDTSATIIKIAPVPLTGEVVASPGLVTVQFEDLQATSNVLSSITSTVPLPFELAPSINITHPTKVYSGGTGLDGSVSIASTGNISFFSDINNQAFSTVTSTGFERFSITYESN